MPKLHLPDVTLAVCETRLHPLAKLAVEDCLALADFAETVVVSDRPFGIPGERHVPIADIASREELGRFGWTQSWKHIETSHSLAIQYDSWILAPEMWDDGFLAYDYIGAPWWYFGDRNVGNGGFALYSRRLLRHIAENGDKYPHAEPSDEVLCRTYRPALEAEGFRWAPEDVALRFSFERTGWTPASRHFGFHGVFNWPRVLTRERLIERLSLCNYRHFTDPRSVPEALALIPPDELVDVIDRISEGRRARERAEAAERSILRRAYRLMTGQRR